MRKRNGLHQSILFLPLLLIIFSISIKSYSAVPADTNAVAYFPMKTGTIYVFYYDQHIPGYQNRIKSRITKDTVFSNGHKYFKFSNYPTFVNDYWYRVDSTTGSIYRYDSNSNCSFYHKDSFVDSLAAMPNDILYSCGSSIGNYYTCQALTSSSVFNMNVFVKRYYYYYGPPPPQGTTSATTYYSTNFGIITYDGITNGHFSTFQYTYTLLGCVMNGVVYGDTAMNPSGIINLNSSIPEKFSLAQNFPNPFNPETIITFNIPKNSFVKLKVYDVSGKELTVLVNGNLDAGSYNYQWDGDSFTSGVYFYRLEANEFVETKRMVLIK